MHMLPLLELRFLARNRLASRHSGRKSSAGLRDGPPVEEEDPESGGAVQCVQDQQQGRGHEADRRKVRPTSTCRPLHWRRLLARVREQEQVRADGNSAQSGCGRRQTKQGDRPVRPVLSPPRLLRALRHTDRCGTVRSSAKPRCIAPRGMARRKASPYCSRTAPRWWRTWRVKPRWTSQRITGKRK